MITLRVSARAIVPMGLAALCAVALIGCARPEAARDAGNLGTRVCLTNQTNGPIEILFSRADTSTGSGQVTAGGQACAEGTFATDFDVVGSVTAASSTGSTLSMEFFARNPWMGAPRFVIYSTEPTPDTPLHYICTQSGWDVGESHSMTDSGITIDATRLADDQWKEFAVVIRGELVGSASPAVFRTAAFTTVQRIPTEFVPKGC